MVFLAHLEFHSAATSLEIVISEYYVIGILHKLNAIAQAPYTLIYQAFWYNLVKIINKLDFFIRSKHLLNLIFSVIDFRCYT